MCMCVCVSVCVDKPVAVELSCHATAFIILSICLEDRNVFPRFDEIPLMTL